MQSNSKKSSVNETRKIRSRTPLINNELEARAPSGCGAKAVCSMERLKEFRFVISADNISDELELRRGLTDNRHLESGKICRYDSVKIVIPNEAKKP